MELDKKYFFWGCGRPVQWGLYSPVTDRFVCVDSDYQIFEHLVFLLSSKIRLLIVPIHCAPNFKIDLIDNTCCTNWAVTNWPPASLQHKFLLPKRKHHFFVNDCGKLIEKPAKDLIEIQNFIFLICSLLLGHVKFFTFCNLHVGSKNSSRRAKSLKKTLKKPKKPAFPGRL